MDRRRYLQVIGGGSVLSLGGCAGTATRDRSTQLDRETVTLAAGTTVHDSGVLAALNAGFEDRLGVSVDAVIRGSGGALRTARGGDCDLVLVHARTLEDEFLRGGHGINRRSVMVNDFLVVGPRDDPAGVAGENPISAFEAIAAEEAPFLSRGDGSGTHVRERQIWTEAGIAPTGSWYSETGQGMGTTLTMAAEVGGYTLTERGSFLTVETDGALVAHVDRGIDDPPPLLRNEYAVIPVNPARHDVAYTLAMAYVGHVTGTGQDRIGEFRVDGDRAFRPFGPSRDPNFEQYVPADWQR